MTPRKRPKPRKAKSRATKIIGVVPARMALAMAREAHAPANEDGSQPCVVYASDEVHM